MHFGFSPAGPLATTNTRRATFFRSSTNEAVANCLSPTRSGDSSASQTPIVAPAEVKDPTFHHLLQTIYCTHPSLGFLWPNGPWGAPGPRHRPGPPPAASPPGTAPPVAPRVYRRRAATAFRGVTQTRGTNTGTERYDVQFVFCDAGVKRHPKIYGFGAAAAASRAFDVLLCRRSLEKGRAPAAVAAAGQSLGTNHPLADYSSPAFAALVGGAARDDVIYGLKVAAKRGLPLGADTLCADLQEAMEAAAAEDAVRRHAGETRQSYGPGAAEGGGDASDGGGGADGAGGAGPRGKRKAAAGGGAARGNGRRRAEEWGPGDAPAAAQGVLPPLPLFPGAGSSLGQQIRLAQLLAGPPPSALQPLSSPGAADPTAADPAALNIDANDPGSTAEPPRGPECRPNGLEFLQDVCRAAAGAGHPELHCVADLVRIWDLQRQGAPWESHALTLPPHVYRGAPAAAMAAAGGDLRAALAACHAMWQRRALHAIFGEYMAALSGAALPEPGAGPPPKPQ